MGDADGDLVSDGDSFETDAESCCEALSVTDSDNECVIDSEELNEEDGERDPLASCVGDALRLGDSDFESCCESDTELESDWESE